MQNINHYLRKHKTKIEQESWLRQFHRTLDSLGNNLMGMLWMINLSLAALQKTPDIDQAKNNLQDALKAGDRAKDLVRLLFNSLKPKLVGTPIFLPQSGPRIKQCKIYYSSRKNGEYLRQVINSSGIGIVGETDNLKHLPAQGVKGVDVVILEYNENNPKLDQWIEKATANPQGPPIYLYFHNFSMVKLWQAMHLGVKECLIFPVNKEQLQAAVNRIEDLGNPPTGKGDSRLKTWPLAPTTWARVKGGAV